MRYIVISSAAKMPGSCWGVYRRVAVVAVDHGHVVRLIRDTKHQKVVRTWEKLNVGTTSRCAYSRALAEARQLADELEISAMWRA